MQQQISYFQSHQNFSVLAHKNKDKQSHVL